MQYAHRNQLLIDDHFLVKPSAIALKQAPSPNHKKTLIIKQASISKERPKGLTPKTQTLVYGKPVQARQQSYRPSTQMQAIQESGLQRKRKSVGSAVATPPPEVFS
jgi:hypothetical protein